ncbi:MAG: helix-turn-helix domain-containing protein [Armatimonadetes bacterium]|nr:helix-turn-helix domain-containing protein [Armatimonadota bacterium]
MNTAATTSLDDLPLVMTVQEAAKVLRLKRSTAYELVRQGAIPSFKVGRHIRVSRVELEKLIVGKREG